MSSELQALQVTLESLLKQRQELNRNYMEQDKQLWIQTKDILSLIREIEDDSKGQSAFTEAAAEIAITSSAIQSDLHLTKHQEAKRAHLNYERDVVPCVLEILSAYQKLKGKELVKELKNRYGIEFSNVTVSMRRVIKLCPNIKKIGNEYHLGE